jgi:hypothetical protein
MSRRRDLYVLDRLGSLISGKSVKRPLCDVEQNQLMNIENGITECFRGSLSEELKNIFATDEKKCAKIDIISKKLEYNFWERNLTSNSTRSKSIFKNKVLSIIQHCCNYQKKRAGRSFLRSGHLDDPRNMLCEFIKQYSLTICDIQVYSQDDVNKINTFLNFLNNMHDQAVFRSSFMSKIPLVHTIEKVKEIAAYINQKVVDEHGKRSIPERIKEINNELDAFINDIFTFMLNIVSNRSTGDNHVRSVEELQKVKESQRDRVLMLLFYLYNHYSINSATNILISSQKKVQSSFDVEGESKATRIDRNSELEREHETTQQKKVTIVTPTSQDESLDEKLQLSFSSFPYEAESIMAPKEVGDKLTTGNNTNQELSHKNYFTYSNGYFGRRGTQVGVVDEILRNENAETVFSQYFALLGQLEQLMKFRLYMQLLANEANRTSEIFFCLHVKNKIGAFIHKLSLIIDTIRGKQEDQVGGLMQALDTQVASVIGKNKSVSYKDAKRTFGSIRKYRCREKLRSLESLVGSISIQDAFKDAMTSISLVTAMFQQFNDGRRLSAIETPTGKSYLYTFPRTDRHDNGGDSEKTFLLPKQGSTVN